MLHVFSSDESNARLIWTAMICFLPEGQRRSFEFVQQFRKDYHSLHTFPEYGHLDVFMGQNAANDTFPVILGELNKPS
jgi:hypothetical protein